MEWVKERDLLIAQTLAFVQSVNARKADIRRSDTKLDLKLRIETAPIDATRIIEPPASVPVSSVPVSSVPVPRKIVSSDFRAEVQARVASFRAHQERFNREREEYFSTTLAKVRAALGEDFAPAPLRK
jgi:hypothetical protein